MAINSETIIDVDTMLHYAGDFGRYQIILIMLFSVINVLSGFHYFGQTFISVVPDHYCKPSSKDSNPQITTQCTKILLPKNTSNSNGSYYNEIIPCTNGWTYNNTHGYKSIVEELNWVCDDDWKPAIGQSVFFIGSVMGTLVFGVLADRIGRLHVLVMSNMCAFVGNLVTVFSDDVTTFAASRFIAGCATDTNFVMMYIIG